MAKMIPGLKIFAVVATSLVEHVLAGLELPVRPENLCAEAIATRHADWPGAVVCRNQVLTMGY